MPACRCRGCSKRGKPDRAHAGRFGKDGAVHRDGKLGERFAFVYVNFVQVVSGEKIGRLLTDGVLHNGRDVQGTVALPGNVEEQQKQARPMPRNS